MQAGAHGVAGRSTWGCRPEHVGLQVYVVSACIRARRLPCSEEVWGAGGRGAREKGKVVRNT